MSIFPPGPRAPESNPPINPQYYAPRAFFISALSLGTQTTVTTSVAQDFVVGQLVKLLIPPTYGSFQLNNTYGYVTSIPSSTQVVVNINSSSANAFIANPSHGATKPQIVPIGDVNSGTINSQGRLNNGTFIPGAFIDISPI